MNRKKLKIRNSSNRKLLTFQPSWMGHLKRSRNLRQLLKKEMPSSRISETLILTILMLWGCSCSTTWRRSWSSRRVGRDTRKSNSIDSSHLLSCPCSKDRTPPWTPSASGTLVWSKPKSTNHTISNAPRSKPTTTTSASGPWDHSTPPSSTTSSAPTSPREPLPSGFFPRLDIPMKRLGGPIWGSSRESHLNLKDFVWLFKL